MKENQSEPVAVLVVPAEGDPGGLLAWSLGQFSPPVVSIVGHWRNGMDPATGRSYPTMDPPSFRVGHWISAVRTLPLWWDGALVPEGWDRARRLVYATGRVAGQGSQQPDLDEIGIACRHLLALGLASRFVLLDFQTEPCPNTLPDGSHIAHTGLPSGACEDCMNTGVVHTGRLVERTPNDNAAARGLETT